MYATDWADGFRSPGKTLGASAFLYFAVLAPAIAFGGAMTAATSGVLGPRDVILSCGLSGMAYATLAGQPMTFVAPTGLTLAFIGALSSWTVKAGVPFLPIYAWCGVWTSCYLAVLASFNASGLIKYCTRFTEDVFNALLAFNFLSEGASPIVRLLRSVGVGAARPGDALLAMNSALATSVACTSLAGAPRTRFFTAKFRTLIADFGPAFVIVAMSALLRTDAMTGLGSLARLELGAPRAKMFSLVDLGSLAVRYRLLAAIPALFFATLFFLDQNITVRTVNSPQNKLAKDSAYHLDLLALATITLGSSLLGLPWMCSATVQSLNHVRAMSNIAASETIAEAPAKPAPRPDEAKRTVARRAAVAAPVAAGGGGAAVASMRQKANATAAAAAAPAAPQKPEGDVASVVETRLSGFLVHGLVLASLNVAPLLSQVPLAVVWGVFLFLGQKVMSGNQFLGRSKALLLDTERLDPTDTVERAIVELGRGKVLKFTAVQAGCLATLWLLKLNKATAMVFPSVIGVVLALRAIFIPRFFAARELLMDTGWTREARRSRGA
ncbi:inorganic anion exchanger [Aureococcus anophagefferens]|nr:inorganic anion exchanger [Aureococcus anophagefferens]